MDPAADAMVLIAWHHRPRLRHGCEIKTCARQLEHETCRTHRVVAGNIVAYPFKVRFGGGREFDDHSAGRPRAWYWASRRAKTSAAGRTRPASASARPRAIA